MQWTKKLKLSPYCSSIPTVMVLVVRLPHMLWHSYPLKPWWGCPWKQCHCVTLLQPSPSKACIVVVATQTEPQAAAFTIHITQAVHSAYLLMYHQKCQGWKCVANCYLAFSSLLAVCRALMWDRLSLRFWAWDHSSQLVLLWVEPGGWQLWWERYSSIH